MRNATFRIPSRDGPLAAVKFLLLKHSHSPPWPVDRMRSQMARVSMFAECCRGTVCSETEQRDCVGGLPLQGKQILSAPVSLPE